MTRHLLAFLGLLTLAGAAQAAPGPSFDCAQAHAPLERLICADPKLAAADAALAAAYTATLEQAGPDRDQLVQLQRAWLKRLPTACAVNPAPPPGEPGPVEQTACLITQFQDRAEALPGASAQVPDRDTHDTALEKFLADDAFMALPTTPDVASGVFNAHQGTEALLGQLTTLRLYAPQSEANLHRMTALLRQLEDRQKSRFRISFPEMTYAGLDGLGVPLVYFSQDLSLPCKLFAQNPGLLGITGSQFGGAMDNWVPRAVCTTLEYPWPAVEVKAVITAASAYDGGAFGHCTGTIRFAAFAQDRMAENIARLAPQLLLPADDAPHTGGAAKRRSPSRIFHAEAPAAWQPGNVLPLENWGYQSVANRHAARHVADLFRQAQRAISAIYQNRFHMDAAAAQRAAAGALWGQLLWAAAPAPPPFLRAIMDADAKPDLATLLAAKSPRPPLPEPALSLAAERPDAVRLLLTAGENPDASNKFGKTPLMTAAQFNDAPSITLLLAAGANINAQTLPPEKIPDNDLSDVKGGGFPGQGCGEYHIQHGGRTALIYAAANASLGVIRQLLAAGADPSLRDSAGLTALDYLQGKGPVPANPVLGPAEQAQAVALLRPTK